MAFENIGTGSRFPNQDYKGWLQIPLVPLGTIYGEKKILLQRNYPCSERFLGGTSLLLAYLFAFLALLSR